MIFSTKNITLKNYPWNPEKLELIRDYIVTCPKNIKKSWSSKDGTLDIVNDKWTIKAGFQFDDCTWVPSGSIDNTPNLPVISLTNQPIYILWKAAICHDMGYNNLTDSTFPFIRKDIDNFFYVEIKKTNFKYPKIYYYGVRLFGGIFLTFKKLNNKLQ